jgi:hypothetical protein
MCKALANGLKIKASAPNASAGDVVPAGIEKVF